MCVDHCHKTSKIRGLICRGCNTMIAMIELNTTPELIRTYLDGNVFDIWKKEIVESNIHKSRRSNKL